MASEGWQQIRVDEMIRRGVLALNDGYRVRNFELGPVGIPFVRGGDIRDGGINMAVEDHIRPEFADRVQSKLTRPFDVAFITKGTVGRVGIVRPGQPVSVFAPQVCYWRSLEPEQLDPRFLFFLLTSAEFQANLDAVKTHGSMAADYVSMTDQRGFRLTFPPIREQKAIAAVLGALDDKIELDRRMIETLDAITRALFKSWFVDFDPVRAKAEGRDPGLPKPLAEMFPARLVASEAGEIPAGWVLKKLQDLFSLDKGLSYKGLHLDDKGLPMVNLGCFLGQGKFEPAALKGYSGEFQPRHTVREGDLVMANTDITQKREVIGSPGMVPPTPNGSAIIFTHHVFAARFHEGLEGWRSFAFHVLLRDEFRERATVLLQARRVLALPRDAVLDFQFAAPPTPLLDAFTDAAQYVRPRQWNAQAESFTLAALRDALLPKLLSGELRIPDAERMVEAAV